LHFILQHVKSTAIKNSKTQSKVELERTRGKSNRKLSELSMKY